VVTVADVHGKPTTNKVAQVTKDLTPAEPQDITAFMLVADPDVHLTNFCDYWDGHRPDLSAPKVYDEKTILKMKFWKKNKDTKVPHTTLPGCCSKFLHTALDFAIARNLWPVKFKRKEAWYDMTVRFSIAVWGCYCAQMYGKPELSSKACQKVLAYLLSNPAKVVLAYRKRVYFYASATIVKAIEMPIKKWLQTGDDDEQDKRTQALVTLNPEGYPEMFGLVGNCIVDFMRHKHTPFPLAFRSKQHFNLYESWKRAQIWTRTMRAITGLHANKHWNNYGYNNFKLNVQTFTRYMLLDSTIIRQCSAYHKIPDEFKEHQKTPVKKKKKSSSGFDLSSPECPPSTKTTCTFSDSDSGSGWESEA